MADTEKRDSSTVQSIERAASIMRSFSEFEPELGVTELSRRLGLHKSTVSRILSALQREGFVGQNQATGKYRLGVGLISLAGVALGRVDVRAAAFDHLDALVRLTHEGAGVAMLDGNEAVIVLDAPSPQPVRYVNWIGRRLPLHCTASGKVLLSGMPPSGRWLANPQPLHRYTTNTITATKQLDEELADIAAKGYAVSIEEFELGYSAIAAPIHNHAGQVVGAVSLFGPSFRLPRTMLIEFSADLCAAAARISTGLGYSPHMARSH